MKYLDTILIMILSFLASSVAYNIAMQSNSEYKPIDNINNISHINQSVCELKRCKDFSTCEEAKMCLPVNTWLDWDNDWIPCEELCK